MVQVVQQLWNPKAMMALGEDEDRMEEPQLPEDLPLQEEQEASQTVKPPRIQ